MLGFLADDALERSLHSLQKLHALRLHQSLQSCLESAKGAARTSRVIGKMWSGPQN
jgi:hypothetical protein